MAGLQRELGLRDLVLFHVVAIIGLRWIAVAAQAGPSSLTLWTLAFLLFFVPQAAAVMRLTSAFPDEGGIYRWTQRAFGDAHGFIAGWCYWSNNVVYFPTVLITMAGYALFITGPGPHDLESSRTYLLVFSLISLWIVIGTSMIGLKTGKWLQNIGGLATWIPAILLTTFGMIAAFRFGSATSFSLPALLPDLGDSETITFFSSMCFGFAGLELASIMGGEIRNPRRNGPRAVMIAGISITAVYLIGTWALMTALPKEETSVITGVIQAIGSVGERIGLGGVGQLTALLVTFGSLAAIGAWLGGSARILYAGGLDRYFPPTLGRIHPRWGTPYIAIMVQGIAATIFVTASVIGASAEEAYLLLLDTTLVVYFIPYLYMFASLIRLNGKIKEDESTIRLPGGQLGATVLGGVGFLTTAGAILLALIPPESASNKIVYQIKVGGGGLLFIIAALLIYVWARRRGAHAIQSEDPS